MLSAPPNPFRLAWATDIHLEFCTTSLVDRFLRAVAATSPDAFLITGDIGVAANITDFLSRIESALACPAYFVLGNHDFYGGSIADVRSGVAVVSRGAERLHWLREADVITLAPGVALVGVDGWADARFGDYGRSTVQLNDYVIIRELAGLDASARRRRLESLGDEEAALLNGKLRAALSTHARVIVGIHVPPFAEAAWHEGRMSDDEWLPHFSSKACGDVLLTTAESHPQKEILVLCGHTHGSGEVKVKPNLRVITGGAEYGAPRVQQILEL